MNFSLNPIVWLSIVINEIIFRPIFNLLLVFVALTWWSLGWWIILLTIFVRLLLLKPYMEGNNIHKHMTDLQPKIKEIQEKYKDNPQKMNEEIMKLFQQNTWAFKGMLRWCIMMLVQIPIFLGLFYVVRDLANILSHKLDPSKFSDYIYSFLNIFSINAEIFQHIDPNFFGINLLNSHNLILSIIAWILMFIQFKFTNFINPQTSKQPNNIPWMPNLPDMSKMMLVFNLFFVFMIMTFVYSVPAAIWLYIVVTTLFSILQMIWQYRLLIKARFFS